MKRLGDLFSADKIPGFKEAHIRHTIAATISRILQVPVVPKQVKYEDGSVYLSTPPVVKSAILLKTAEIQETLQKEGIKVANFK
jgi:hypothetical protein